MSSYAWGSVTTTFAVDSDGAITVTETVIRLSARFFRNFCRGSGRWSG